MERFVRSSSKRPSTMNVHAASISRPSLNMNENDGSHHNQNDSPLICASLHPPTSSANESVHSGQSSATNPCSSNCDKHTPKRLKTNNSTTAPNEADIINLDSSDSDESEAESITFDSEHDGLVWKCYLSGACRLAFSSEKDAIRHAKTNHKNFKGFKILSTKTTDISIVPSELNGFNAVVQCQLDQVGQPTSANSNAIPNTTTSAVMPNGADTIQPASLNIPGRDGHQQLDHQQSASSNSIHQLTITNSATLPNGADTIQQPSSVNRFGPLDYSPINALNRVVNSIANASQMCDFNVPSANHRPKPTCANLSVANMSKPIEIGISRRANRDIQQPLAGISCGIPVVVNTGQPIHLNRANREKVTNTANPIPNWQTTQQQQPAAIRVSVIVNGRQAATQNNPNNTTHNVPNPQASAQNNVTIISLRCNHCDFIFDKPESKEVLIAHKWLAHRVRRYECIIAGCSKSFDFLWLNTQHRLDEHKANKLLNDFRCKVCPNIFSSYRSLYSHYFYIHSHDQFKCPFCQFESTMERRVISHVRVSHSSPESDPRDYHLPRTGGHKSIWCLLCYKFEQERNRVHQ